eukprot:5353564-Prorocentrum_lima.AAC.1
MGGLGVNTWGLLREVAPIAAWRQARGRVAKLSGLPATEAVHEYNRQLADPIVRAFDCQQLAEQRDTL